MKRRRLIFIGLGILLLITFIHSARAQSDITLKEIIEKNILFSGGKEKMAQIQNYSFRAGQTTYYCSSSGELKTTTGRHPAITEVLTVNQEKAQRNVFNEKTELSGLQKAVYQCLAKLYSGLFTLLKFESQLELRGLKSFGPEKFFELATQSGELKIGFYLRTDDFSLKRILFQGFTPEGDKYEVNYDFGPFEEIESIKIPTSWYSSQVGTRGTLYEASDIKFNLLLEQEFFTELEVNMGNVEAEEGSLKGNVIDFNVQPNFLVITTNWMKKDIEKAGFKTLDVLVLAIEGIETEIVFYALAKELPAQSVLAQGTKIMSPSPRGLETFIIAFYSADFSRITPMLKPLVSIQARKK